MFNPQDDPLGLGLKQRARDHRATEWAKNPSLGGLMSPVGEDWDAYFQAVGEATGGKQVKFGQATEEGGDPAFESPAAYGQKLTAVNQTGPYDQLLQQPSRQLGTLSLKSLKQRGATLPPQGPQ